MLARSPLIVGLPAGFSGPLIESGLFTGLPKRRARLIYHDFPILFRTRSPKGEGRSPQRHYSCFTIEETIALGPELEELCARVCAMAFWWPISQTHRIPEFLKACGFRFSTLAFVWVKARPNHRGETFTAKDFPPTTSLALTTKQTELCWYAWRGASGRLANDIPELILAAKRQHSRKPDEARARLERLFGEPRIELFARTSHRGWISWGLETNKFDGGPI
jgi:N6-adenosine-specific RNA methylase IME4